MHSADALLVVQLAFEDSQRPVPYVPGKVYEYLATGKPILAPVPPGDLRDLLLRMPQAYVSGYEDPADIADALLRMCTDIDEGRVRLDRAEIAKYDRRLQCRQLADLFDRVSAEAR